MEQIPTPTPHASQAGWSKAGSAWTTPNGVATTAAITTATARRSTPPGPEMRCPSTTYRTKPTQLAAAQARPAGLPARLTWVSRATPAADERQRHGVASRACAVRREGDHPEELDAGDRGERAAVEGQVERRVHAGQDHAEGDHDAPVGGGRRSQHRPRAAPDCEHDGGRGEPEPGDPERVDVDEQQDRERRAQVVEAGAEHHGAQGRRLARSGRVAGETGSETSMDMCPSSKACDPI